jgi:hypothetical protein
MKHNINELYTLENVTTAKKIATLEYCKANAIPVVSWKLAQVCRRDNIPCAIPCSHYVSNGKPLRVLDENGSKFVYMFGEKTYFDTQEELDSHRKAFQEQQAKEREINKLKKELLAKVEGMSAEELKKIIEKI